MAYVEDLGSPTQSPSYRCPFIFVSRSHLSGPAPQPTTRGVSKPAPPFDDGRKIPTDFPSSKFPTTRSATPSLQPSRVVAGRPIPWTYSTCLRSREGESYRTLIVAFTGPQAQAILSHAVS
jgi:hypothetical protein